MKPARALTGAGFFVARKPKKKFLSTTGQQNQAEALTEVGQPIYKPENKMKNTHKIHTYTIADHPDPEKVCDWIRNNWHDLYSWQAENNDSLNGFAEFFNVTIKDWSIDPCGPSYCDFDAVQFGLDNINRYEYMDNPLRGVRLWKYLKKRGYVPKDCEFTGYCADEWLLDPIRKFIKNPDTNTTMQDLCDEAFANWAKNYLEDWEYTYTDEAITETCEANQYEFTEDGQFWS